MLKKHSLAAIDMGSNTLRVVCAYSHTHVAHSLKTYLRKLWVVRLGKGFNANGYLIPSAMDRAIKALSDLVSILIEIDPDNINSVATGVIREARNQAEFLDRVKKETGITIRVLEGEEEAATVLIGVRSTLQDLSQPLLVCDIGGGSTEFALLSQDETARFFSIPLGAIRLIERFQIPAPMTKDLDDKINIFINDYLTHVFYKPEKIKTLVATAGTPTTLASIDQALKIYNPLKVHGYRLKFSRLREIYKQLSDLNLSKRACITGLEYKRADIIVPGTAILLNLMQRLGIEDLIVSEGGLLEGVLAKKYKEIAGIYPKIFF